MVKVQKPTPKTFLKVGKMEEEITKQKSDKIRKLKKAKHAAAISAAAPAKEKKIHNKTTLIKETVKEAKIVDPVKNVTEYAKQDRKQNKPKKQSASQQTDKKKKGPQAEQVVAKKPLVLAPPKSPVVGNKNKKQKKSNAATASNLSAPIEKSKLQKKKANKGNAKDVTTTATQAKFEVGTQASPSKMKKKNTTKKALKRLEKNKRSKSKKQQKKPVAQNFEALPFDEEKFIEIVNVDNIKQVASGLKTLVEEQVAKNKSIFSDYHYFLNVVSFKIPSCPKRMVKLSVKHSLVDKDDDVVIIVPDLQRGSRLDYEPTKQHYEDLFREAGVENLKIIPFNQLRTEYSAFESLRKFSNTYDYYLCDGRMVGQVVGFCGKIFQKSRSTFHSVRMNNTNNLKKEIEKSLRRTAYKQLQRGDLIAIPVGNHKFTMQQLAENVEHVVSKLKTLYPGGWANVRSMYLKIDVVGTSSLPIYLSGGHAPPAVAPYVVGPREKRMLTLKKEANEVLSKFNLTKEAAIIKLTKKQVEHKRKLKEMRAALLAKSAAEEDQEADGEETGVPAKKARKEKKQADSKQQSKTLKAMNAKQAKKHVVEEEVEEQIDDEDDDVEDEEQISDEEDADGNGKDSENDEENEQDSDNSDEENDDKEEDEDE